MNTRGEGIADVLVSEGGHGPEDEHESTFSRIGFARIALAAVEVLTPILAAFVY